MFCSNDYKETSILVNPKHAGTNCYFSLNQIQTINKQHIKSIFKINSIH